MKISKAVLKSIAIAVAVGVTQASCTKKEYELLDKTSETDETNESNQHGTGENSLELYDCPACGRG